MGCNSSKSVFSQYHQAQVKRTWEIFKTADNAEGGVAWFTCVFENHHNLRETWGDKAALSKNVNDTIDTLSIVVSKCDMLSEVADEVNVLGMVYADETGDITKLQTVIETIKIALETGLEEQFSDDVKVGWAFVLDVIKASMSRRIESAKGIFCESPKDTAELCCGDTKSIKSEKSTGGKSKDGKRLPTDKAQGQEA